MPKSPDPYLGLARLYVYSLRDVDRAEDALKAAEKRGHEMGRRERAQLADGYRDRGERLMKEASAPPDFRKRKTCSSARKKISRPPRRSTAISFRMETPLPACAGFWRIEL